MAFKVVGTFDVDTGNSLQATDAVSKGMQTAANSTSSLKKELREMQQQLATLDPNSKAFQELSIRAGQVKDQINDASEAVRANAGNAFEGLSNNAQLLGDRLLNLDFEGVASAAQGLGANIGRLDFKTLSAGVNNAASSVISLGKALLTNPLFWIGAAITALIVYWDDLAEAISSVSEETKRQQQLAADLTAEMETNNKTIGQQIVQIDALFDAVSNQNLAEADRKQALKDLQTLYPDVLANQNLDINNTNALTAAKLSLIETIKAEAKANAARSLLEKKYAEQLDLELQLADARSKQASLSMDRTQIALQMSNAAAFITTDLEEATTLVDDLNKKMQSNVSDIAGLETMVGDTALKAAQDAALAAQTKLDNDKKSNNERIKSHRETNHSIKNEDDKLQQQLDKQREENRLARLSQDDRELEEFKTKYANLRTEAKGNQEKLTQIDQLEFDELFLLLEKQSERQTEFNLKEQEEARKQAEVLAQQKKEADDKAAEEKRKQQELGVSLLQDGIKKELAELTLKYEADLLAAGDNAELKRKIEEKYTADITAIDNKYRDEQRKKDEEDRQARIKGIQDQLNLASQGFGALSALGDVYFENRKSKLKGDEKASKELAEKQFKFNKKMQLAGAIIDAGKAITASLAQAPVAIGALPNPAGIASLAFASVTSAANIAKILATKFDAGGGGGNNTPNPSIPGAAEGGAPQFNPLASAFINNRPGQLGPSPAYVLAGDVTSAQEARNKVQDLARL
jgi:hypothetical protein